MAKRFDYAKKIGCDGIEPDNTGAYQEATGFPIKKADSVRISPLLTEAYGSRTWDERHKNCHARGSGVRMI